MSMSWIVPRELAHVFVNKLSRYVPFLLSEL